MSDLTLADLLSLAATRQELMGQIDVELLSITRIQEEIKQRREAIAEIETTLRENAVVLKNVMGSIAPIRKPRAKATPKFQHPSDPTKTWAGRGKRPSWAEGIELVAI